MAILIVDNYDSFTYNLVHLLQKLSDETIVVKKNDEIAVNEVEKFNRILFSPGPGIPSEAGTMNELIKTYAGKIPMLGVCLGHQAMAEVFGGTIRNTNEVYHGIATAVTIIQADELFKGVENTFEAGRYHSWIVEKPLPAGFTVLAEDDNGYIMAMVNKSKKMYGVQFHPESIMTPDGEKILENWLEII